MDSERFEMRVPKDLLARLDAARGHEPRASFVKRALEKALAGEATITIEAGVIEAAKPVPLKFSPEEELAHAEAVRRETARQLVPKPKAPAKDQTYGGPGPVKRETRDAADWALERQRQLNAAREKPARPKGS